MEITFNLFEVIGEFVVKAGLGCIIIPLLFGLWLLFTYLTDTH